MRAQSPPDSYTYIKHEEELGFPSLIHPEPTRPPATPTQPFYISGEILMVDGTKHIINGITWNLVKYTKCHNCL